MARTGKKPIDSSPAGIVIIQADEEGFDLKISQNMNYDDAKHLLMEALHIIRAYEESGCIPDNMTLQ